MQAVRERHPAFSSRSAGAVTTSRVVGLRTGNNGRDFLRLYEPTDILLLLLLLAETDTAYRQMSGPATVEVLWLQLPVVRR